MTSIEPHLRKEFRAHRPTALFLLVVVALGPFPLAWIHGMTSLDSRYFLSFSTTLWAIIIAVVLGTAPVLEEFKGGRSIMSRLPDPPRYGYLAKVITLVGLMLLLTATGLLAGWAAKALIQGGSGPSPDIDPSLLRVAGILFLLLANALALFGFTCWTGRFGPALLMGAGFYCFADRTLRTLDLEPQTMSRWDQGLGGLAGSLALFGLALLLSYAGYCHRLERD